MPCQARIPATTTCRCDSCGRSTPGPQAEEEGWSWTELEDENEAPTGVVLVVNEEGGIEYRIDVTAWRCPTCTERADAEALTAGVEAGRFTDEEAVLLRAGMWFPGVASSQTGER